MDFLLSCVIPLLLPYAVSTYTIIVSLCRVSMCLVRAARGSTVPENNNLCVYTAKLVLIYVASAWWRVCVAENGERDFSSAVAAAQQKTSFLHSLLIKYINRPDFEFVRTHFTAGVSGRQIKAVSGGWKLFWSPRKILLGNFLRVRLPLYAHTLYFYSCMHPIWRVLGWRGERTPKCISTTASFLLFFKHTRCAKYWKYCPSMKL